MQIVDEDFLESLNSLLTFGRVPGLFSTAEMDEILVQLQEDEANIDGEEMRGDRGKPKSVDYGSEVEGDGR